ncbi:glycosyltransferase involved in cell wall biosynthesis [Cellulophaga sp. RHA19]|uniref:glycosyltransferase family 4 protein n=1 Tax=Cellulophaga sp. RHA19 TaxID=1798237 RepID=UPI000C2BE330|nr:glycosyltransferase family 1 protein [Cellulophaga sp. RHA19]PKB43910.1 glycosyltransferase involved in cell wall biosynthesis [Cellulophaga sp. RHA19]
MIVGFDAKRIFHNNTGLGNYGRDLVRIICQHTNINKLILYNTKPSNKDRVFKSPIISVVYPNSWLWKKFSSIWRVFALKNSIINDNPNIYHGITGEIPLGLNKTGVKSIVTIHDLIFITHPQYYSTINKFIYTLKFKYAVKNSTKIVAISEQTKKDIIKYSNVSSDKITVVYQGCNSVFKKEYSTSEKEKVKVKYNLPNQFILNVGTIQERKNALLIVKAINGTKNKLVLIGNEEAHAKKIREFITEHNLEDQVYFLKNVELKELAIIYQLATVFCYPSLCEGFGIPIIEALYSKTPVITTMGNCFPEAGGPNSFYIKPNDDKDLKLKINTLFSNPEIRQNIAKKGLDYAQNFNDDVTASNMYSVYKSIL